MAVRTVAQDVIKHHGINGILVPVADRIDYLVIAYRSKKRIDKKGISKIQQSVFLPAMIGREIRDIRLIGFSK